MKKTITEYNVGNLDNQFMVIKDDKYKVYDKQTKVMYECASKKRAFELAKELNEEKR